MRPRVPWGTISLKGRVGAFGLAGCHAQRSVSNDEELQLPRPTVSRYGDATEEQEACPSFHG